MNRAWYRMPICITNNIKKFINSKKESIINYKLLYLASHIGKKFNNNLYRTTF
jgi:hypothetical protein